MRNHDLQTDYFIPFCNLHYDIALSELTAREFRTYLAVLLEIKGNIGPNTKLYFPDGKTLHGKLCINIAIKTFYSHLRSFERVGLIQFKTKELSPKSERIIDLGFDIASTKLSGFTRLGVSELEYLLTELDYTELKLYVGYLRLLRGFKATNCRLGYPALSKRFNLRSKAAFFSARNYLQEKGFINLRDYGHGRTQGVLLGEVLIPNVKKVNDKPSKESKKPKKVASEVTEKLHLKKTSSLKENIPKESSSYTSKAQRYEQVNRKKIFELLKSHYKTQSWEKPRIWEMVDTLVADVTKNGGYQGAVVKTTPSFYLTQENATNGSMVDKILERVLASKRQDQRQIEARDEYYARLKEHYPEEVEGMEDYQTNPQAAAKLDELIKRCPPAWMISEEYTTEVILVRNTKYNPELAEKGKALMSKLMQEQCGDKELNLEERFKLVVDLTPLVDEHYPGWGEADTVQQLRKFNLNELRDGYLKTLS